MSLENIFGMAGGAMDAQSKRLSLAVENIANSDVLAGDQASAYKAKRVNFATILQHQVRDDRREAAGGIRINDIFEDDKVVPATYQPDNPLADEDGFVYPSNVDSMIEMVEITQASRAFESNIEAMNTAKQLASRTLEILRK
ncbi:MAG: flagellar basal body rod protein FlgC [Proteobacteria bacterium]|nr:flagellar basal body rod protein FlgC [Pseudomonadota bacterium]